LRAAAVFLVYLVCSTCSVYPAWTRRGIVSSSGGRPRLSCGRIRLRRTPARIPQDKACQEPPRQGPPPSLGLQERTVPSRVDTGGEASDVFVNVFDMLRRDRPELEGGKAEQACTVCEKGHR